ncbi:MAG: hypothetical protein ABSD64_06255 [Terriglobales bacterium]|jgi:hypothetical protein
MAEEIKHGMECTEFEALLCEAIEGAGQLSPARNESFDAHRRVCAVCGPLFAEVQAGRQWLKSLEAVEPPVNLVHNILIATSGVVSTRPQAARAGSAAPFGERAREWWDSFFTPLVAFVRQPRFVMSFGMIFFTFSLVLSAAGVKPKDVAKVSLRPAAVRHAYNDAQIRVVKYYDNIRFVYEIESKLRELKRANTPAEPSPEYQKEEQKENRKDNTSGQPEQRQDRNYSKDYNQPVLAALRDVPSGLTATGNRRFV